MDTKEAIKRIDEHNRIHFAKEFPRAILITEALDMAAEALERQTPKKVKKKYSGVTIHPCLDYNYTYRCPNCNHLVRKYEEGWAYPQTRNNYCNVCGQALDWE